MIKMEDRYLKFNKSFMYVMDDKGDKIDVPSLVARAFNRYRYDITTKELQMKCLECNEWITVMQIQDSTFKEIEGQDRVEKIYTRDKTDFYYSNRCRICNNKLDEDRDKENEIIKDTEKNSKYTLYLRASNKEYLEFKAAAMGLDIAAVLNALIEKDKNPESIEKLKIEFSKRVDKKFNINK